MIINFLQTRDPPVLPALQQSPFLEPKIMSGLNVAFDKNIACYRGYGSHNSDSLGALLFQFFRYYGHEVDFEISVMSVRTGKVITKFEKNWHLLQDNRLCVEEPFNTSRNLGNTADDTSVRGIHLELRRAFRMVSEANLARCCEQYEPPAHTVDEVRPLPKQNTSANRPILAYPSATLGRLGRGGGRGGRHNGQVHRNSNAGRRASTASTRVHAFSQPLPVGSNVTQAELNLQAQQQQYLLHDRLFQQYQYLQAQEQELRAQLRQQAVLQGRMMPSSSYPQFLLPYGAYSGGQEEFMRARAGSVHQPPLTPPIRPQGFSFATAYPPRTPVYGSTTNPPSPLLHSVAPDSRRSYRRSSFTNGSSGGTLRAQSQPARPVPSPLSFPGSVENHPEYVSDASYHHPRNIVASSGSSQEFVDILTGVRGRIYQSPSTDRRGSEYIGYYLGHSPPLPIYSRSAIGSPFGGSMGSGIENGAVSPQVLAQVPPAAISLPPLSSGFTRPSHRDMELTDSGSSDELPLRDASTRPTTLSRSDSGPVVVNGSLNQQPERRKNIIDLHDSLNTMQFDASTSDDIAVETPTSSDDSSQGIPEPQTGFNEHVSNSDSHITPVEHFMKRKGPKRPPRRVNGHSDVLLTSSESKDSSGSMSVENQVPRANGTVLYQEAAVGSDGEGDEKPLQARAFQLSPVKEVRTPSPTQNRQLLSTEDSAGGASKAKLKSKPKQVKTSITDHPEEHSDPLGIQPNGLTFEARSLRPPNNMGPASGWQTQKRKSRHKKGSKSEADVTKVNSAGGEFLPLDESLRKGG